MLARLRRQPRPRCCTPYRCRPTLRRRAMTTAIPARLIPRGPMQRPHSLPYRWRDAASPRKICRRHAWAYPRARLSRCAGLLRIDVVPPRRRHERRRAAGPYAGPLSLPAHGVHAVRPDRSGRAARLVAAHESEARGMTRTFCTSKKHKAAGGFSVEKFVKNFRRVRNQNARRIGFHHTRRNVGERTYRGDIDAACRRPTIIGHLPTPSRCMCCPPASLLTVPKGIPNRSAEGRRGPLPIFLAPTTTSIVDAA